MRDALVTILLVLRPALWLGLRVADSFGQHLAQLSLRLRRLARGLLPLGHGQYVGTRQGELNPYGPTACGCGYAVLPTATMRCSFNVVDTRLVPNPVAFRAVRARLRRKRSGPNIKAAVMLGHR